MKRFYSIFALIVTISACLVLSSCNEQGVDEPIAAVTFAVSEFPSFEPDSRAIGTPDEGKNCWETGDELLVVTDAGSFTTLTRSEEGAWSASGILAGLTPESQILVTYAPNHELVEGVVTLKADRTNGTNEYFTTSAAYAEGVVTIAFSEVKRNYSRLRIAGAAEVELAVAVTKFIPAGTEGEVAHTYTLTTNENGNTYLYGTFAEGATIQVTNGSNLMADRTLQRATEAEKSYVVDARNFAYFLLPTGSDIKSAIKAKMGSYTQLKFVAGSPTTSDEVFFTDANGSIAYKVINGDWLEIHTACKEFLANADCRYAFSSLTSDQNASIAITAIDLNGCFNTSETTNMRQMFFGNTSLTSLKLKGLNTSKVTTMQEMFLNCQRLTSLDLSHFDTSEVTNMSKMFSGCKSLTTLDVSSFNTAKVTTTYLMFGLCEKLTTLDVSSFNTAKVTDMIQMFSSCKQLSSLDLTSFSFDGKPKASGMFINIGSTTDLSKIPVYVSKKGSDFLKSQSIDSKVELVVK